MHDNIKSRQVKETQLLGIMLPCVVLDRSA